MYTGACPGGGGGVDPRSHGDGLLVAGLFFTDYPPSWEKIPPC